LSFSRTIPTLAFEAKIWEAATGQLRWQWAPKEREKGLVRDKRSTPESFQCRFSPDGRLLALGVSDRYKIVSSADFRELELFGVGSKALNIAFSPDNRYIAATIMNPKASSVAEVAIWDAATLVKRVSWQSEVDPERPRVLQPTNLTLDLVFSPDGRRIIDTQIRSRSAGNVHDVASGKILYHFDAQKTFTHIAFTPDGKRFATAAVRALSNRGELKLWDAATGRELLGLGINTERSPSDELSFSPDGYRLRFRSRRGGFAISPDTPAEVILDATPRGER
jgi:WD40 repeat protein